MRQSYLHEIFLQQTVHPRFCHLHGADLVGDVTAFDQYHLQLKAETWTQPWCMGYTSRGSGSGLLPSQAGGEEVGDSGGEELSFAVAPPPNKGTLPTASGGERGITTPPRIGLFLGGACVAGKHL